MKTLEKQCKAYFKQQRDLTADILYELSMSEKFLAVCPYQNLEWKSAMRKLDEFRKLYFAGKIKEARAMMSELHVSLGIVWLKERYHHGSRIFRDMGVGAESDAFYDLLQKVAWRMTNPPSGPDDWVN